MEGQGESGRAGCVIILSAKSSGSSMLQRLLATDGRVRTVRWTRHGENETLYWTKAASILGLQQIRMLDSEVPIPAAEAGADLVAFLDANLGAGHGLTAHDRASIFEGWRRLCFRYAPVLVEKSPHHLLQWSALELIAACMAACRDVDFLIVGLVRNPMDTIYSAWKRWRIYPEQKQVEWAIEYGNLLNSRRLFGDRLIVLRYEDIVADAETLRPVRDALGVGRLELNAGALHAGSIGKWRDDPWYGFTLAEDVAALAGRFGYHEDVLENPNRRGLWIPYRNAARWHGRTLRLARETAKRLVTPVQRGR